MHFLLFILIGAVAGWLAGTLIKGGGFGLIGDIVVGIVGAVIGGWLAEHLLGVEAGSIFMSLVIATIGAIILLLIIRAIKRA